jgi:hypothetical protein
MEVVGDAGVEARVIGYVETFFEYCQMTDMHYEGIDVECAGDAVGFWMQECIALRSVEPKGRISAGKVLLPRQSIELVAVCEVRFRMKTERVRKSGRTVGTAIGLLKPALGRECGGIIEVLAKYLHRKTIAKC